MAVGKIYIIKNVLTHKFYIGQTWQSIRLRFLHHCSKSRYGCPKLNNAIQKYGRENFTIEVLYECADQRQLDMYEDYFILVYDAIKDGYNLKYGGRGGTHSEETRKLISEKITGRKHSAETIAKLVIANTKERNPMYGKKISEKTRELKSEIFKGEKNHFFGKKHEPEMIKKMSEIKSGDKNPMYGKSGVNSPTFGRKMKPEEVARMLKSRAENRLLRMQSNQN